MKSFVLEFVGKHSDGHFEHDLANSKGQSVGFNGKRQIMEFAVETDASALAIAEGMRKRLDSRQEDIEVLLHDRDDYLAWLENQVKRIKKGRA